MCANELAAALCIINELDINLEFMQQWLQSTTSTITLDLTQTQTKAHARESSWSTLVPLLRQLSSVVGAAWEEDIDHL